MIFSERITGNKKATSISKIRNTTAKRKNRIEKGSRAESLGSNPHSKGVFLLRDIMNRFPRIMIAVSKISPKTMEINPYSVNFSIVSGLKTFLTVSELNLKYRLRQTI